MPKIETWEELAASFDDRMEKELRAAFGSIYKAPIPETFDPIILSPAWFREFRWKRRFRAATGQYFTPFSRMRYWQQRVNGQGYDDVGGHIIRCWKAACGYIV